jgi:hypothetical protein
MYHIPYLTSHISYHIIAHISQHIIIVEAISAISAISYILMVEKMVVLFSPSNSLSPSGDTPEVQETGSHRKKWEFWGMYPLVN